MKIVNLTPHTISVVTDDSLTGVLRHIPSYGYTVRLESEPQTPINFQYLQIPVVSPPSFKSEIQWPEMPDDVDAVLVSMPVGQQIQKLGDRYPFHVMGPDTGPDSVVRDSCGQILGVKRLVLYAYKE